MEYQLCQVCGRVICAGRLKALPGVTTCVEHSDAVPYNENNVDLDGADQQDLRREVVQPDRR